MKPLQRKLSANLISLAVALSAGAAAADPPLGAPWLYERMATAPLERGQIYLGFTA